ncbi:hypothetical protein Tco_1342395 [Tanacetum coccineum]
MSSPNHPTSDIEDAGCYRLVSRANVIENKVETLTITTFSSQKKFFLLEELLLPKKRGYSSSSTSALPQDIEIRESSRKTSLERHKEQIEEILNHLDELSLDRIENIEDKIEGLEKVG